MAWTRLQVFTAFSALFLTALTAIAAYTMHTTRNHNLPIPSTLSAFTLALPLITGLAMQSLTLSIQKLRSQKSNRPHTPPYTTPTLLILFIYDAVLATLAGTYITPISNLHCGLEDKWQGLWHAKNGKAIRRIQDAFECCGLHSTSDRAYPFPGKDVGVDGCRRMFGYEGSCFGKWRGEERKVAGMMLVVVGCVGLWKILILVSQAGNTSWFSTAEVDAEDGETGQRSLEYPPREGGYRDEAEEVEESDEDSRGRLLGSSSDQPSAPRNDQNEWASERAGA